jgi:hypothetical protein
MKTLASIIGGILWATIYIVAVVFLILLIIICFVFGLESNLDI